jgi:signal transduction histidine kinase
MVATVPRLRPADWIPALLLGAASLYEIWVAQIVSPGWPGNDAGETGALAFLMVGIALRRAMPLRALCLVGVSAALQHAMLDDPEEYQVSFEAFLGLILTAYSVAVNADRLRALQALVIVFALHVAVAAWKPSSSATEDAIGMFVVLSLIWGAGSAVRARQERIADLERGRAAEAALAVAEERGRIARELHDIVAHAVSVMVVQIGGARHTMESDPEVARDSMRSAEAAGREALTEMRRLVGLMREGEAATTDPTPGLAALPALAERFTEAGLPVTLAVEPGLPELPAGTDLAAYRVVQEGLTNALKHAGPVPTDVQLRRHGDRVEIEVRNGPGRAGVNGTGGGHGLIGLRERVGLYGGHMQAGPEGEGFALRVELPL